MFTTPDENTAEGWNQIGDNVTQSGKDGSYWLQKAVEAGMKGAGMAPTDVSSSVTSGNFTGGEAQSMLSDFNLDGFSVGGDTMTTTQSMLPDVGPGVGSVDVGSVDVGSIDVGASVGDLNMDVSQSLVSADGAIAAPAAPGAPAGDMLGGVDNMLPGGDAGIGGGGDALGGGGLGGMASGFFQFLLNFLTNMVTELTGELGHQASQAAESAAIESTKKLAGS